MPRRSGRRLLAFACSASLAFGAMPVAAQFGDDAPAPIPAERLEAARKTVAAVFPAGTYAVMMDRSMAAVSGNMMDMVGDLPLRDFVASAGASAEELDRLGKGTLREMMEILDPAYEERMAISMTVMKEQMTEIMSEFEPAFQDGLARAYARRFDLAQLTELNRFFATPTGAAYARESMTLFADPEVMGKMREVMPAVMKRTPQMVSALAKATEHLPKPRTYENLTPEERERLEALIGTPPASGD